MRRGDTILYRYYEDFDGDSDMVPENRYYLECKGLMFTVGYYEDDEDRVHLEYAWEHLKQIDGCITVAQGEVNDYALHGNIMSMETIPGYRFSFRPSTMPSWSLRVNVHEGNTVYDEGAILVTCYMNLYKDGEYKFFEVNYEKNADTTDTFVAGVNMVDTGLRFGDYVIYENTKDYITDREFLIILPESDEIIYIESWDMELTPELAKEIFELALVPIEQ